MGKRPALVEAYLGALEAKPLLILAGPDDRTAQISFNEINNLNLFDALWFSKPHHAELVLMNCETDLRELGALQPKGAINLSARTVRDYVVNVADNLGACWRTAVEIQAGAGTAVDQIVAHVEASRQSGGLAQVNASYKIYRQQQLAKGEKAIPYSAHLFAFTRSLVTLAAANARLI